jgi:hypothetical protein
MTINLVSAEVMICGKKKIIEEKKKERRRRIEERRKIKVEKRKVKEELKNGAKIEEIKKEKDGFTQYSTIMKSGEERYVGIVLERHLLTYFKDIIEIKTSGQNIKKPVDWIYNIGDKEIKIKQISSRFSIIVDDVFIREIVSWRWDYNDVPDVFILSIWSDIQKPIPLYVFVIGKHEIVGNKKCYSRSGLVMRRIALDKYSKFLISKDGLGNMQKNFEKRLKQIEEYNQRYVFIKNTEITL